MKNIRLLPAAAISLWLTLSSLNCLPVHAQNLRAATSSSYLERGNEWFAKGEYARAEADFTQAIKLQPQLANTYALRGLVRLLQNRVDAAQQDFDQCLTLDNGLRQSLERMIAEVKRQVAAAQ